ncbi:MAG: DNA repair protein RecO [Bacteroidetes bacterium]|nr:MAG: DNA repair protein RecO [Bacteroidota bacterium]
MTLNFAVLSAPSPQQNQRQRPLLHHTRAIVLKKVAYADSSLIVTAYTEKFGLQHYIIKGARRVSKSGHSPAGMYQPAALLDMMVYNYPHKPLNYTKEVKWGLLYQNVLTQVVKNAVATMMMELLTKCVKEPEPNPELFGFVEQYLRVLDEAEPAVVAAMPLHFMLQLAAHLGFQIENNYCPDAPLLDLTEGRFVHHKPLHTLYLEGLLAAVASQLLSTNSAVTLYRVKTTLAQRRQLISAFERFYDLHIAQFGSLKTVAVLEAVLA